MNNMILLENALLIKESTLMTYTLLPVLQHGSLDMLFQCCFCAFNWATHICNQELATLIHKNTWTTNIAHENNKSLNTFKIFIANTASHRQSKIKCSSPISP